MTTRMRSPCKKARAIVIHGKRWWYRVGRAGWTILVWDPNGAKRVTNAGHVLGLPPQVVERGQWKQTTDGMVTPRKIADWIERQQ